ncbi:MAG: DNA internalization-related competence protein ComEC/Rec2 [Proteobacteria bacterium]|nr:DNA internalization-related competence protein ComEC/Rec2 [Pseudomonadota bacterium]
MSVVGLLPWQGALLAGVFGILAIHHPISALISALVLWLTWVGLGGRARTGFGMGLAFVLGLALAAAHLPATAPTPAWVGQGTKVLLHAVVDSVESRPDHRLNVLLRDVSCTLEDGSLAELPGRVAWSWDTPTLRPEPGREVSFKARIDQVGGFNNPGQWDYAFFQRTGGILYRTYVRGGAAELAWGAEPGGLLWNWRTELAVVLAQSAPDQGGAMLAALLTGDRFSLSPETIDLLRAAGLSHTLALSGLHLGFVILFALAAAYLFGLLWPGLLLRVPRPKLAVLLAVPLVAAYLWLGQFTPSLIRSACMFGFMALLLLQGRSRAGIDGLFLALALILLVSPLSVFDIRLQLSAVAVGGIIIFMPTFFKVLDKTRLGHWKLVRIPLGLVGVSCCATLVLLPLTARTFGMTAPNLLLNLLWLPLLGFVVMPLGWMGLALYCLPGLEGAAGWCFHAAGFVLGGMQEGLAGLDAQGALPLFQLLRPLWPEMLGVAVLLACLAAVLSGGGKGDRIWWPVLLGVFLLATPHVWVMTADARDEIRLEVVDVGQGLAQVLTLPGGRRTVMDGGGLRSTTFDIGRDVLVPYLTLGRPPRVDRVILSHPHADHYKGFLHLLAHVEVGTFQYGCSLPGGSYRKRFKELLAVQGLTPERLYAGDQVDLGRGVRLSVLYPFMGDHAPSTNDGSLVLRLEREGQGLALLPGDVEKPALQLLLDTEADLASDVLVLPHHGSVTSFVPALYDRVDPLVAMASSGERNKHIQPATEVLAALAQRKCEVVRTWQSGLLRVGWKNGSVGPLLETEVK